MPNLLKDVLGILDELQIRKVHCVVGHDWGAALAWQLAGRFPDRFERLAALSVGHNASMFSMGGNKQREKSWYMLFFKVHIHVCAPCMNAPCVLMTTTCLCSAAPLVALPTVQGHLREGSAKGQLGSAAGVMVCR